MAHLKIGPTFLNYFKKIVVYTFALVEKQMYVGTRVFHRSPIEF